MMRSEVTDACFGGRGATALRHRIVQGGQRARHVVGMHQIGQAAARDVLGAVAQQTRTLDRSGRLRDERLQEFDLAGIERTPRR
jgi:hypothetical protein